MDFKTKLLWQASGSVGVAAPGTRAGIEVFAGLQKERLIEPKGCPQNSTTPRFQITSDGRKALELALAA